MYGSNPNYFKFGNIREGFIFGNVRSLVKIKLSRNGEIILLFTDEGK